MVPSPLSTVADFAKKTLKMSGQNGIYTISTGNFFSVASEQNHHFNIREMRGEKHRLVPFSRNMIFRLILK